MANLIRSAKSANDWSANELLAYNITVRRQNAVESFGRELGLIDHLDSNLLSTIDISTFVGLATDTYQFLGYLDIASHVNSDERPINDLVRSILQVTRFQERGTILCRCYNIPFTICSDRATNAAKIGVCLIHHPNSMIFKKTAQAKAHVNLRLRSSQRLLQPSNTNNKKRLDLGLRSLESMTIPCITMMGTRPSFHKVPVTMQLSSAVASGKYPQHLTIVTSCAPPDGRRATDGMGEPDYRLAALQYFDAFHQLAKSFWTTFLPQSTKVDEVWGPLN